MTGLCTRTRRRPSSARALRKRGGGVDALRRTAIQWATCGGKEGEREGGKQDRAGRGRREEVGRAASGTAGGRGKRRRRRVSTPLSPSRHRVRRHEDEHLRLPCGGVDRGDAAGGLGLGPGRVEASDGVRGGWGAAGEGGTGGDDGRASGSAAVTEEGRQWVKGGAKQGTEQDESREGRRFDASTRPASGPTART